MKVVIDLTKLNVEQWHKLNETLNLWIPFNSYEMI